VTDAPPVFPSYAPPDPKLLMKAVRAGLKRAKKIPRIKKLIADPPGCKLHLSQDVKVKSKIKFY
jgi:hypothetical protein